MKPLLFLTCIAFLGCSFTSPDRVERAQSLSADGSYEDAITEYRTHIEERLGDSARPSWENPYFYLLSIGDIQLAQNNPSAARATYEEAEQKGVEAPLITDRFLALALWYEKQERYKEALDLLSVYRLRDPELLNGTFTRVAKKLTAQENR